MFLCRCLNAKRNDEKFRLITVSRLIERKGIQYILNALSEIKDRSIHLSIIGEGNYEKELRNMCNKLGLDNIVTFMGFPRRDAIPVIFFDKVMFLYCYH